MGRIEKGVKCSLIGCNDKAIRSLSFEKVESIGMKLEGERRAYLCEKHYKEYKKKNKNLLKIEKWRWQI